MGRGPELHNKPWRRASCNSLTRKLAGGGADLDLIHTQRHGFDRSMDCFRFKTVGSFELKFRLS